MPTKKPVTQLCDSVTVAMTPAFKKAVQSAARRRGVSLAEYARDAMSGAMIADGVRHKAPSRGSGARGADA